MGSELDADAVIAALGLAPHPEGGWFVETWRDPAPDGGRGTGTAIYFLLRAEESSHWHRVDAAETWHHYAGAPVELAISESDAGPVEVVVLGSDVGAGQRPQATVPSQAWQAARPRGGAALVGCTVSPAFAFEGFTLAAPGWAPGAGDPAV